MGLSTIKLPSTTGTNTKVPKKPLAAMLKLTVSRVFRSTLCKHENAFLADAHLNYAK